MENNIEYNDQEEDSIWESDTTIDPSIELVNFFDQSGAEKLREVDNHELFLDGVLVELPQEISNLYIENNKDFIKEVCTTLYEKGISTEVASVILHSVITSVIKNKPDTKYVDYAESE